MSSRSRPSSSDDAACDDDRRVLRAATSLDQVSPVPTSEQETLTQPSLATSDTTHPTNLDPSPALPASASAVPSLARTSSSSSASRAQPPRGSTRITSASSSASPSPSLEPTLSAQAAANLASALERSSTFLPRAPRPGTRPQARATSSMGVQLGEGVEQRREYDKGGVKEDPSHYRLGNPYHPSPPSSSRSLPFLQHPRQQQEQQHQQHQHHQHQGPTAMLLSTPAKSSRSVETLSTISALADWSARGSGSGRKKEKEKEKEVLNSSTLSSSLETLEAEAMTQVTGSSATATTATAAGAGSTSGNVGAPTVSTSSKPEKSASSDSALRPVSNSTSTSTSSNPSSSSSSSSWAWSGSGAAAAAAVTSTTANLGAAIGGTWKSGVIGGWRSISGASNGGGGDTSSGITLKDERREAGQVQGSAKSKKDQTKGDGEREEDGDGKLKSEGRSEEGERGLVQRDEEGMTLLPQPQTQTQPQRRNASEALVQARERADRAERELLKAQVGNDGAEDEDEERGGSGVGEAGKGKGVKGDKSSDTRREASLKGKERGLGSMTSQAQSQGQARLGSTALGSGGDGAGSGGARTSTGLLSLSGVGFGSLKGWWKGEDQASASASASASALAPASASTVSTTKASIKSPKSNIVASGTPESSIDESMGRVKQGSSNPRNKELPRGSFPSTSMRKKEARTKGTGIGSSTEAQGSSSGATSLPAMPSNEPEGEGATPSEPPLNPSTAPSSTRTSSFKPRSVLDDRPKDREEQVRRERERRRKEMEKEGERRDKEIEEHEVDASLFGVHVPTSSLSQGETETEGRERFPPRKYYILSTAGKPVFVSTLTASRQARAAQAAAERLAIKRAKAFRLDVERSSGQATKSDDDGLEEEAKEKAKKEDEELENAMEASRAERMARDDREDEEATMKCAAIQALISNYATDAEKLRSASREVLEMEQDEEISFLLRAPLYLVCISAWGEPPSVRRSHLEALHNALLGLITSSQLQRLFQRAANFDLRRMLEGTDGLLGSFVERLQDDPALLLGALHPLRLDPALRDDVGALLAPPSKAAQRPKDLLYVLLLAKNRIVTLVRPRKHAVHPIDTQIIINTVYGTKALKEQGTESWIPICLPKFAPGGFVHAHVSFLDSPEGGSTTTMTSTSTVKGRSTTKASSSSISSSSPSTWKDSSNASDLALVLISGNREGFSELSSWRKSIHDSFLSTSHLSRLSASIRQTSCYSADELGVAGLRHFIFKWRANVQLTSPVLEEPYEKASQGERRLMLLYQLAWESCHLHRTSKGRRNDEVREREARRAMGLGEREEGEVVRRATQQEQRQQEQRQEGNSKLATQQEGNVTDVDVEQDHPRQNEEQGDGDVKGLQNSGQETKPQEAAHPSHEAVDDAHNDGPTSRPSSLLSHSTTQTSAPSTLALPTSTPSRHSLLHSTIRPLTNSRRHVLRTDSEALFVHVSPHYELYMLTSPHLSHGALLNAANSIVRWVKREEHRLFIVSAPAF